MLSPYALPDSFMLLFAHRTVASFTSFACLQRTRSAKRRSTFNKAVAIAGSTADPDPIQPSREASKLERAARRKGSTNEVSPRSQGQASPLQAAHDEVEEDSLYP